MRGKIGTADCRCWARHMLTSAPVTHWGLDAGCFVACGHEGHGDRLLCGQCCNPPVSLHKAARGLCVKQYYSACRQAYALACMVCADGWWLTIEHRPSAVCQPTNVGWVLQFLQLAWWHRTMVWHAQQAGRLPDRTMFLAMQDQLDCSRDCLAALQSW